MLGKKERSVDFAYSVSAISDFADKKKQLKLLPIPSKKSIGDIRNYLVGKKWQTVKLSVFQKNPPSFSNTRFIRRYFPLYAAIFCCCSFIPADAEKWIALMKQYVNPVELTAELLNTLIEKITVHEAVKGEDGSREQEVEIYYRFIISPLYKLQISIMVPQAQTTIKKMEAITKIVIRESFLTGEAILPSSSACENQVKIFFANKRGRGKTGGRLA